MQKIQEIISCSRRTDVPAFHYDWLQECLKNKYVMVKNPYNGEFHMVDLSPERVHSICLVSKSYANVLKDPGLLSLYNLYFHFTITGYSRFLESNVIDTAEAVRQVEKLAEKYSPQQINWRFDPIILSVEGEKNPTRDDYTIARLRMFESLCKDISSFGVDRCTFSFMKMYKKVEARINPSTLKYINPSHQQQIEITRTLVEISDKYGINLYTCASPLIEGVPGVKKGHCIDGAYLEELFGKRASRAKDAGQRPGCGCTRAKDIGTYAQSCLHGCRYCYAM